MVSEIRSNGPSSLPKPDQTEQIRVLDITGNIASAKLITPDCVDYITLAKSDGRWRILSVVQQITD
jgi:hypothetical protein